VAIFCSKLVCMLIARLLFPVLFGTFLSHFLQEQYYSKYYGYCVILGFIIGPITFIHARTCEHPGVSAAIGIYYIAGCGYIIYKIDLKKSSTWTLQMDKLKGDYTPENCYPSYDDTKSLYL